MRLIWIHNVTKEYADTHKDEPGVSFGEPRGVIDSTGLVGYYIDPEKIERCAADMEDESEEPIEEL